jgi:prevent-host-death family protein
MKVISQREFRNHSANIMDEVEKGQIYRITRSGTEVAELRPLSRRRRLTAAELVARHRLLPTVTYDQLRREADEFFGTQDRVDDQDPPTARDV